MIRRTLTVLMTLALTLVATSVADGRSARSNTCGASTYSYAGVQSETKAHGVGAILDPLQTPNVSAGHVGAWIGLGGVGEGPHGTDEWIQVGFSAFPDDKVSRIYYEVTVAGSDPKYVELDSIVRPGERHSFKVLETANRKGWWRVWLDGKAVSPAIRLPGSHGAWYAQAAAESWNGGVHACNSFHYRFANVRLAHSDGGDWRPLGQSIPFHDPGYRLVQTSSVPRSFLATSLAGAQPVTSVPDPITRASNQLAVRQALDYTRFRNR
ncbi:MAG: hypothetical protein ACTHNB_15025 [Gaiellaceae bacterium]